MLNNADIVSLWIGPRAQEIAHNFYHFQAEQIFDEKTDPLNHAKVWNYDSSINSKKSPKMLIYDTNIPHLRALRKTNHKKLIAQMD